MAELWDRQRDEATGELEPALWFGRFREYLRQGKARTILGTLNAWRVSQGHARSDNIGQAWQHAAEKWRWIERAQAYDLAEEARVQAEWEARRRELKQKEWVVGVELLERCRQMLQFGPVRTVARDGQTVIEPADWRFSDVAPAAKAASSLARLAAEMDTEHVRSKEYHVDLPDPRTLTPRQRARILAGEDILLVLAEDGKDGQGNGNGDGNGDGDGAGQQEAK